jgi:hypothetical protein
MTSLPHVASAQHKAKHALFLVQHKAKHALFLVLWIPRPF